MRVEQLTFTRFIAAILIVIHHFGISFFPFNKDPLLLLVAQAPLYVSYFFVLSGFVMIVAYNNKEHIDSLKYIQKRFARIYPVYLLAIIILATYSYTQGGSYYGMLFSVLLIQAWIPYRATDFNAPAWSLSVEMLFYLVFPFLFNYFYKRKYIKIIAVTTITIWIVTQVLFLIVFRNQPGNFLSCFPLMHLNEFLMGNLGGLLFVWKLHQRKANYDWLIILLLAALILALKYPPPYINYQDGMLVLLYLPLIMVLALNTGRLTSLFKIKPLVFLGEISYSIYILQVPVCYWCIVALKHFHLPFNLTGFIIFLCMLILVSAISYLFIEIPLRERINKLRVKLV
jgi:peptidoglycan/LPS O-acetylase OafA/YrhL